MIVDFIIVRHYLGNLLLTRKLTLKVKLTRKGTLVLHNGILK